MIFLAVRSKKTLCFLSFAFPAIFRFALLTEGLLAFGQQPYRRTNGSATVKNNSVESTQAALFFDFFHSKTSGIQHRFQKAFNATETSGLESPGPKSFGQNNANGEINGQWR